MSEWIRDTGKLVMTGLMASSGMFVVIAFSFIGIYWPTIFGVNTGLVCLGTLFAMAIGASWLAFRKIRRESQNRKREETLRQANEDGETIEKSAHRRDSSTERTPEPMAGNAFHSPDSRGDSEATEQPRTPR